MATIGDIEQLMIIWDKRRACAGSDTLEGELKTWLLGVCSARDRRKELSSIPALCGKSDLKRGAQHLVERDDE
jgi:hypothetical protein